MYEVVNIILQRIKYNSSPFKVRLFLASNYGEPYTVHSFGPIWHYLQFSPKTHEAEVQPSQRSFQPFIYPALMCSSSVAHYGLQLKCETPCGWKSQSGKRKYSLAVRINNELGENKLGKEWYFYLKLLAAPEMLSETFSGLEAEEPIAMTRFMNVTD